MKQTARLPLLLATLASLGLAACASSQSAGSYERSATRGEMTVRLGTVESVRAVTIEGSKSAVGPAAGAVVGGIAGSHVGSGSGSTVGAVLGAVAGGVAGSVIEESVTRKPGIEITIRLDSGQLIAVTQEADVAFQAGDRVRVLSGQGVTRVTR